VISFSSLNHEFADLCLTLITKCANEGILLRPYSGVRSPSEQAKLWRQGREIGEIETAARKLKDYNAPYLASCLLTVGPQKGARVTNALPGESWHQWGEALDFFVLDENNDPITDGHNSKYFQFAKVALSLGLTSGAYWTTPDPGHVQLRAEPVKAIYQWPDINRLMREKYEN